MANESEWEIYMTMQPDLRAECLAMAERVGNILDKSHGKPGSLPEKEAG